VSLFRVHGRGRTTVGNFWRKELLLKHYAKFGLPALLVTVLILAASCGNAGGSAQGTNHGKGGKSDNVMKNMDHGSMDMDDTASKMLMKNGKYSDERFIDSMVPHHQGAVEMAEVGLKNADHKEIKDLSRNIISTQKAEIEDMKSIKKAEFGTSKVPMNMSPKQMDMMGMMMDPKELADKHPFDKAFIDNMIPHHQSAIDMAEVALKNSDNPKIKELAGNIVKAQKREISQMEQWRKEWYPKG
jgi:uncharacterized protein (DUF305 family)